MRKVLVALGALLVLLVAAVVLIPLLFRDRLVAALSDQLSQSLNADVHLDGVNVTLLSSFPDLTLEVIGLKVSNRSPFDGTDLARIGRASVTVALPSALRGGPYEVHELILESPEITLLTDAEGRSNTDVAPAATEPAATPAEPAAPLTLRLEATRITEGKLRYQDQQAGLSVTLDGLNHEGQGSLDGDVVQFQTTTDIGALTVEDSATALLRAVKVQSKLDLGYNLATGAVRLGDNALQLNALPLRMSGSATPQGADWDLDLTLEALPTTFREVLSLVPAAYKTDLGAMKIDGGLSLRAAVRGLLRAEGDDLPPWNLALKVDHGSYRDPGLPVGVDEIDLDLAVDHPGGTLDAMVVDLRAFSLALDGQPLRGRLRVTHVETDPDLDLEAKGTLDLGRLTAAFPIEGTALSGRANLDLAVRGRVSALSAGDLAAASAQGTVTAQGLSYQDTADPLVYRISALDAAFSPQTVTLSRCDLILGDADLAMTGTLDNVYAYALGAGTLGGDIAVVSKTLDLTPFAGEDEPAPKGEPAPSGGVATVPTDLALRVDLTADRLVYPPYDLSDVRGGVTLRDGKVDLEDLSFGFLDGRVGLAGSYAAPTAAKAEVAMSVSLADFGLGGLVDAFDVLETIAPIARGAAAKLNSTFELKVTLGPDLTPDLSTFYSKGWLRALGLKLKPDVMAKVADLLKDANFKNLDLSNTNLGFEVSKGKVQLDRTAVLLGGVAAVLLGQTGVLDQSLDLQLELKLPLQKLQGAGLGQRLKLDQLGLTDGPLPVTILIGGTTAKPTVDLRTGVLDSLKSTVTAAVQAQVGEVVDAALEAAKKAGDQLVAEAQKVADALVSEAGKAGQKLKDEADKQADKLLAEAKGNTLAEAAAKEAGKKIRKEAADKAKKLSQEADKRGQALVTEAEKKKDKLIADAAAKAGR